MNTPASANSVRSLGLHCIRKTSNGACVIFAHGVLSDGEAAWGLPPWPELLAGDPALPGIGIYNFTYFTNPGSGSYSIDDVADMLRELFSGTEGMWDHSKLIFVGHSMGGIVARRFIVANAFRLIEHGTRVGLILLASPTRGSDLANRIAMLTWLLGHNQASALRMSASNIWLEGLHREFLTLKESGRLWLKGREFVEGKPMRILRWLGISDRVVEPTEAAVYFADSLVLPEDDHSSIAKPGGRNRVQYSAVTRFIAEFGNQHHLQPTNAYETEVAGSAVSRLMTTDLAKEEEIPNSALAALHEAILETRLYVGRRDRGERNADVEERLARVWMDVANSLPPSQQELADLCRIKGQAWADPSLWNDPRFKNLPVELNDILARISTAVTARASKAAAPELKRGIAAIQSSLEQFEDVRRYLDAKAGRPTSIRTAVTNRLADNGEAVEFEGFGEVRRVTVADLKGLSPEDQEAVAAVEEAMRKLSLEWQAVVRKGLLSEEDERQLAIISKQMAQRLLLIFGIVEVALGGALQDHYAQQRTIAESMIGR